MFCQSESEILHSMFLFHSSRKPLPLLPYFSPSLSPSSIKCTKPINSSSVASPASLSMLPAKATVLTHIFCKSCYSEYSLPSQVCTSSFPSPVLQYLHPELPLKLPYQLASSSENAKPSACTCHGITMKMLLAIMMGRHQAGSFCSSTTAFLHEKKIYMTRNWICHIAGNLKMSLLQ